MSEPVPILNQLIDKINYLDDREDLTNTILFSIAAAELDPVDEKTAISAVAERCKQVIPAEKINNRDLSAKLKIIRKRLTNDQPKRIPKPDWLENWVWIDSDDCFYHLETGERRSIKSFELMFTKKAIEVGYSSIMQMIKDNELIDVVNYFVFRPDIEQRVIVEDGINVVNAFSKNRLAKPAEEVTEKGKYAFQKILAHLKLLVNTEEYAKILMEWIAHNVQFPGKKINWAIIILSEVEGIGKGFLKELMSIMLHDDYVRSINADALSSKFTDWAEGSLIGVFEEVRVAGENRHIAANNLKTYIADRRIDVHRKGKDRKNKTNFTNYIGFSNDAKFIPLSDNDRRYFLIENVFRNNAEFEKYVGMRKTDYFNELNYLVDNHSAEILKQFMDHEISQKFLDMYEAPITDEKLRLIETEKESQTEGVSEILEIIQKGYKFVCEEVVCIADLFSIVASKFKYLDLSKKRQAIILSKMGYKLFMQNGKRVQIRFNVGGESVRKEFWTRRANLSIDDLRSILSKYHEELLKKKTRKVTTIKNRTEADDDYDNLFTIT